MSASSPSISPSKRLLWGLRILKSFAYVAYSTTLLFPILSTPLVADDFAAPFYQFYDAGPGITSALKFGWNNANNGVTFRILGMPIGSVAHFLYVDLAGRFGIPISSSYFIVKLIIYLGVGIAASWVCSELLRFTGKVHNHWSILFLTATTLFLTLQNHGLWSSDPVVSFPLAGFGSVVFGLVALGFALRITRFEITGVRITVLSFLTIASVLYYEINVAVIVGITPFLAIFALRVDQKVQSSVTRKVKRLLLVSIPCIVPALLLLFGRMLSDSAEQTYSGTTIRIEPQATETFLNGLISTLPTSSWGLSMEQLGADYDLRPNWLSLSIIAVVLFTIFLFSDVQQEKSQLKQKPLLLAAGVLSLVLYWFVGLGMQSITVKVQDESPRIGYVYTYYAIGSTVVAILISVTVLYFGVLLRIKVIKLFFTLVLTGLGLLQLSINWNLMDKMHVIVEPNHALLVAFSEQPDVAHRCKTLFDWTSGSWPDYYEEGMINGIQTAYNHYHHEKFCPNFVRPTP
jgi:hypothetical protein